MSTTDPCTCNVPCPHGVLCSGGHANYPHSHWWPCCEQGCAGEMHTIHMLKLGGYIAVMAGCGHALVGEELGPLTRQGAAHLRDCAGHDERIRTEGRQRAIEEVSKGLPASSSEIAAWLDAVNRLGETYDRALRDEIADLRQHGGMISAHWVAQALEHIADHGHRPPGPGEPPHIHHVPEPESEQP